MGGISARSDVVKPGAWLSEVGTPKKPTEEKQNLAPEIFNMWLLRCYYLRIYVGIHPYIYIYIRTYIYCKSIYIHIGLPQQSTHPFHLKMKLPPCQRLLTPKLHVRLSKKSKKLYFDDFFLKSWSVIRILAHIRFLANPGVGI